MLFQCCVSLVIGLEFIICFPQRAEGADEQLLPGEFWNEWTCGYLKPSNSGGFFLNTWKMLAVIV